MSQRKISIKSPIFSGSRKDTAKTLQSFCFMENTRMPFFFLFLIRTEIYNLNSIGLEKKKTLKNLKFETVVFYIFEFSIAIQYFILQTEIQNELF